MGKNSGNDNGAGLVDHLGLSPSSRPTLDQQIKPHPTRWQYPLIKYLDNKDDSEDKKDENKKSAASGMVSRVSNIFAAMKKSVQKPKESKYSAETPESEMKVSSLLKQKNSKNEL